MSKTPGTTATSRGRQVWAFAHAVHRMAGWRVGAALALSVAVGFSSGAAALLLVPLVQSVGLDPGATGRHISRLFADALALIGQRPTAGWALLAFVAATALQSVMNRLERTVDDGVEQAVVAGWRTGLFARLSAVNWVAYSRYRTSDLLELLLEQTERAGAAAQVLLRCLSNGVVATAYVLVAVRISPAVTGLAVLGAAGLVMLLAGARRRTRALGAERAEASKALYAVLTESIGAMKSVRAYNAEARQQARLAAAQEDAHERRRDLVSAYLSARQLFDVGSVAALGVVAYVALVLRGTPPAELFVLLFVFARVAPQLSGLHENYQHLLGELPAVDRLLTAETEARAGADGADGRTGPAVSFVRAVALEGVTFGYGDRPVLEDVSVRIERGQTVAIVGPSGSGKTTIADVVLGLLRPQAGRLVVDDVALAPDLLAAWRAELGYVAQDGTLFHDSIRANLCWAAPQASERDLAWALEASASAGFVGQLPHGLDTVVGDRGVLLSGGERQRLTLARALLRRPKLLILDEATSSLDSENERLIEQAIESLHGQTSILLITHRLTTARRADVIYVLDAGRLVEAGTWSDLVARRGRFYALCAAQGIHVGAHDARLRAVPRA